ncbi:MAG: DUF4386 domain-containing protein [Myxococcota bacterium]
MQLILRPYALGAGLLYLLGTFFGIAAGLTGGETLTSIVTGGPLEGELLPLLSDGAFRLSASALLTLGMGISLVAMTVFFFPVLRRDSEPLALGVLVFRGPLEGSAYLLLALEQVALAVIGRHYRAGGDAAALHAMGEVLYELADLSGSLCTVVFLLGALCLYGSLYRTRLIPRWLSVWGGLGVVLYGAYGGLRFFGVDPSGATALQIPLAIQELVMGGWLVVVGFDRDALARLAPRG